MLYKDWDVILTGSRIRLTPFMPQDEEPYGRMVLFSLYDRAIEKGIRPESGIDAILDRTEEYEHHAIRPLDSDTFMGWICLQRDKEGRPDLGISLKDEFQCQGYGPEAMALFSNWLHAAYGLERIYAKVSELNLPSQKAMRKIGAVLDEIRNDYRFEGIWTRHGEEPPKLNYYHIDLPIPI